MDIEKALAIAAHASNRKADRLRALAVDLAARRPEPDPVPAFPYEPEQVDDSTNLTVLDVARARVSGTLQLLRLSH